MKNTFATYRPESKKNAQALRKNMTKEERHLWYDFLRNYPVRVYRQRAIGRYIADFYCSAAKLIIELDGSQHYTEDGPENDQIRTDTLKQYGMSVIRFSNLDIRQNFSGVCEEIDLQIRERMKE